MSNDSQTTRIREASDFSSANTIAWCVDSIMTF